MKEIQDLYILLLYTFEMGGEIFTLYRNKELIPA